MSGRKLRPGHQVGRGERSGMPRDPGPRRVETCHIQYAVARRPRMSWQTIGQQIGVNPQALREATEAFQAGLALVGVREAADRPPPKPAPASKAGPPGGIRLRPDTMLAQALLAMAAGVTTRKAMAARLSIGPVYAGTLAQMLRNKDLVNGAWTLTPLGDAHVVWLRGRRP